MIDMSKLEKIKTLDEIAEDTAIEGARHYLRDTDWYVLRQVETGQLIPDGIKASRSVARDTISAVTVHP